MNEYTIGEIAAYYRQRRSNRRILSILSDMAGVLPEDIIFALQAVGEDVRGLSAKTRKAPHKPRRVIPKADVETILTLLEEKKTFAEISARTGYSKYYIHNIREYAQGYGLPFKPAAKGREKPVDGGRRGREEADTEERRAESQ